MKITTKEGLVKAIKENVEHMEMEADSKLGHTVLNITVTGTVAWGVAIGAIAVAVVAVLSSPVTGPMTGGAAQMFAIAPSVAVAAGVLGMDVAVGALAIAVAGGGVGALNKLRDYKMTKKDGLIILTKKHPTQKK